uniref:Peptidase M12B propeptide domain-containing protein n=1 Tax=Timema cristinae TaxID=61476 RepID=A0A7R9CFL9_TIMCR|nr:unnamed protein product [Timema cristinae]
MVFQRVYTGHVPEYELVTPRKVTSEGAFLSHDVTYHHGESHRKRKKRSIYENQTNDAILHYQLSMPGRSYHIELWPSQNFIAPALVVERRVEGNLTSRHYQDGVWRDAEPSKMATTCHYHGLIRGQPTSSVALSACNGLSSMWSADVEEGIAVGRMSRRTKPSHHERGKNKRESVGKKARKKE